MGGAVAKAVQNTAVNQGQSIVWQTMSNKKQVLQWLAKYEWGRALIPDRFPVSLGSFHLQVVPKLHLTYNKGVAQRKDAQRKDGDNPEWTMSSGLILEKVGIRVQKRVQGNADTRLRMTMSESHVVPFGHARRLDLNIPLKAAQMRWVYPSEERSYLGHEMTYDFDRNNDDHCAVMQFWLVGGFIFFDADGNAMQTNTLVPCPRGSSARQELSFECPSRSLPPEVHEKLGSRFQPVTLQALKDAGATHFCWLMPKEEFAGLHEQPQIPFGGFAYKFDHGDHSYFAVARHITFPTPPRVQTPDAPIETPDAPIEMPTAREIRGLSNNNLQ